MDNKKYNFIFIVFIGLFLIFFISGCTVTEENIDEVAAKMQDAYNNINTIQFHQVQTFKIDPKESSQENLEDDLKRGAILSEGYLITKFVTDVYIEKPDKEKIDYSRTEGYMVDQISKLIAGNEMYEEFSDRIYKFTCVEQIRKEPNFLKNLQDILNKHKLELVGTETIFDREAYKIKLETDQFMWIDKETYLPLKEVTNLYEIIYSNYRINEDLSDSIFFPPSNKKLIEQGCPLEKKVSEAPESGEEPPPAKTIPGESPTTLPRKTIVEGEPCDAESFNDGIACYDYCISIGKNAASCGEGICKCI